MNLKRVGAVVKKESLQALRDPSSILIAFVLPLLLLFLMGYAVSLDAKNIKIAIVSKSQSYYAQTLINSFRHSNFFETYEGKNKEVFQEQIRGGNIKAVLEIGEDFGQSFKMQLLIDATEPNLAGFTFRYASSLIMHWAKNEGILETNEIKIESRYFYNKDISSRNFLIPGSIVVVMTMIGTLLTSLVIAREWERGTMEAVMATPATMFEIILGKITPYFIMGMFSLLLCFLTAFFWYEIPFRGSSLILFLLGALYLFPALSIGLLISTLAKNQFVAAQISLVASFLPSFLLSGFLFEIENMPPFLQALTYAVPARYFVNSMQTLFLAGNVPSIFISSSFGIVIIGLFFFILVIKKTKKSLS